MKMNFRSCLTVLLMLALCMFTASALAEQPTVTVGVTVGGDCRQIGTANP